MNRHNLGHPNAGGIAASLQTSEKTMVDTHSVFKNLQHLLIWTEERNYCNHVECKANKPNKSIIKSTCNSCHRVYNVLELVSKELNHLAAILHVYAGGLNLMK
jgi:hypothetical protein